MWRGGDESLLPSCLKRALFIGKGGRCFTEQPRQLITVTGQHDEFRRKFSPKVVSGRAVHCCGALASSVSARVPLTSHLCPSVVYSPLSTLLRPPCLPMSSLTSSPNCSRQQQIHPAGLPQVNGTRGQGSTGKPKRHARSRNAKTQTALTCSAPESKRVSGS